MLEHVEHIGRLAEQTHGLVTVEQVRALGLSSKRRRTLVQRGFVEPIGSRGYRLAGSPRTAKQRVLAACIEVGGFASHRTAAAVHKVKGFRLDGPVEIVVRDARQSARSTLARVHTSTWLPSDDLVVVDGIPTLGVARTLFSLASLVPELSVVALEDAIDHAISSGLASESWLWWRLGKVRCRGRNGVTAFEDALVARGGAPVAESWLEKEVIRILRAANLPLPDCQARIAPEGSFVARVDFRYPDTPTILEANGHRFHASREQLRRDARRRRRLVELGFEVYDFTYDEIVHEPELLIATCRRILARASAVA